MKQNLPLNYAQILTMFLRQRIEVSPEEFDVLTHDDIEYEFDVYEDEELVRVKDLTNKVTHTVTKYSETDDFAGVPHILDLLKYSEGEINYTVFQWIDHLTNNGMFYSGCFIDIFVMNSDKILIDLKGKNVSYIVSSKGVTLNRQVVLGVENDEVKIMRMEKGSADIVYSESYDPTESLLYLLNSEYSLASIAMKDVKSVVTNESIFGETEKTITMFGLKVVLGTRIGKYVAFNYRDHHYTISQSGDVSIMPIKPAPVAADNKKPGTGTIYFTTIYARFNTPEEDMVARTVVNIINRVYS